MPRYETDSKPAKKLEKILKRLKKCVKADEHNRKEGVEDLKFLNGDQWDAMEKRRRSLSGRPALQINLLPKFVDQVVGDGRHNRPRCKVRPADDGADNNVPAVNFCGAVPAVAVPAFKCSTAVGVVPMPTPFPVIVIFSVGVRSVVALAPAVAVKKCIAELPAPVEIPDCKVKSPPAKSVPPDFAPPDESVKPCPAVEAVVFLSIQTVCAEVPIIEIRLVGEVTPPKPRLPVV